MKIEEGPPPKCGECTYFRRATRALGKCLHPMAPGQLSLVVTQPGRLGIDTTRCMDYPKGYDPAWIDRCDEFRKRIVPRET